MMGPVEVVTRAISRAIWTSWPEVIPATVALGTYSISRSATDWNGPPMGAAASARLVEVVPPKVTFIACVPSQAPTARVDWKGSWLGRMATTWLPEGCEVTVHAPGQVSKESA